MDENEELKEFKVLLKNAKVGAELEKSSLQFRASAGDLLRR